MNWFNKLFQRPPIIIVSGLPRSGTSLMMQMLAAGGVPILSDHQRPPDADNPKGYYEFERVKKLPEGDVAWLNDAPGKAVKVISALLQYLPAKYTYRILFMRREMGEILASQQQMLIRRQRAEQSPRDEEMAQHFAKHLGEVESWLAAQPNLRVTYIPHAELLTSPAQHARQITEFLELPLDVERMAQVPDQNLHRQRTR
jgi:hypothetical protein